MSSLDVSNAAAGAASEEIHEATQRPPRKKKHRGSMSDGIWPWLFIAPTVIGIGLMYFVPVSYTHLTLPTICSV